MLCRKVLNALEVHKNSYLTSFVPNPVLSEEGIMHVFAEELGLSFEPSISYYDLLKIITQRLVKLCSEGRRVVLLIDEAQAMPEETLEAIRLLTTVEGKLGIGAALQVVLFGQPELDKLLERPILHELKRNMTLSYQLSALNREGIEAYLDHRLTKAGYNGSNLFTQDALDLIYKGSKGIPRLLNILAHKALMVAFGKGEQNLTAKHIELAIKDTESAQQQKSLADRLFSS